MSHFVRIRFKSLIAAVIAATVIFGSSAMAQSINLGNGFAGATGLNLGGSARVSGNVLRLTRGDLGDQGLAYTSNKLDISSSFRTRFTFQILPGMGTGHIYMADGITFTMQNSGPTAFFGTGGALGIGAGMNNVSIKFDNYDNVGEGPSSTGLYAHGATPAQPSINLLPSGIDLHSLHVFQVDMVYQSNVLSVQIRDTYTGAIATQTYNINISASLGSTTAWVGFTGCTGGLTARQSVLSWEWNASPSRTIRANGASGNDANSGTTWPSAVRTIQRAIDLAGSGGEVWVAAGTYFEHLSLHPAVSVYGGFAGSEAVRDARNWTVNPSVVDGSGAGIGVWVESGAPQRFDGMVIRNCERAVNTDNANPMISNCLIENNQNSWGSGIAGGNSSPIVLNCTIRNNTSTGDGGGLLSILNSSPYVSQSVFTGNHSSGTAGNGNGGAIICWRCTDIVVATNTITQNRAKYGGAALGLWDGDDSGNPTGSLVFVGNDVEENVGEGGPGGLHVDTVTDLLVTDNLMLRNQGSFSSAFSGAWSVGRPLTVSRNQFGANSGDAPVVISDGVLTFTENSVWGNTGPWSSGAGFWRVSGQIHDNYFGGNHAGSVGGGAVSSGSTAEIHHNTFESNNSDFVSGGLEVSNADPLVHDNLFRNNTAVYGGGIGVGNASPQIVNNTFVGNGFAGINLYQSSALVANNIVAFGNGGITLNGGAPVLKNNDVYSNGETNYGGLAPGASDLSEDPKFVNAASGDYSLQELSCLIDRGDDASAIGSDDYWHMPRFAGNHVDIGMRESPYTRETTPPMSVASVSPTPNGGWVKGPATVTLSATDTGTGVRNITYSVSGAQNIGPTTVNGSTATITLTTEGDSTITYYAEDIVCNDESPNTLTVKVDNTSPALTWGAPTPAPNSNGWNRTSVDIPWTATDAASGVASPGPSGVVHFTAEGANQTQTVTVTDVVGNAKTFNSLTVNIDQTPPTVSISSPQDGALYAPGQVVAANWSASDSLSGIDTAVGTVLSGSSIDTSSAGVKTFTVMATDRAGNTMTKTVSYTIACSGGFSSITSNFNGTAIKAGSTIWFNSVLKPSGLGSAPVTVTLIGQKIAFSANGVNYSLPVPDTRIIFDPASTQATTTFSGGMWVTTVPSTGLAGNDFLTGLAFPVPAGGLPGGINPVTWSGYFVTDTPGLKLNWQWAAAVYSSFSSDLSAIGVKPVDDTKASIYQNSDHAGTPESYKGYVIGGARGGGGSNYTGSYSGTASVTPCPLPR